MLTESVAWREVAQMIDSGRASFLCLAVDDLLDCLSLSDATHERMRHRINVYRRDALGNIEPYAYPAERWERDRETYRGPRVLAALWLGCEAEHEAAFTAAPSSPMPGAGRG